MKATIVAGLAALGLIAAPVTQAMADPLPPAGQPEDGWRYTLGLFSFLPLSSSGTSTVSGLSAPYKLDLGDVLDLLDFAGYGRFEAWNGNLGVIAEANYASLTAEGTLPGPLGSAYSVNNRQKWLSLLAAYRVADGTYGRNGQRYTIDIQGGARYNSLRQTVGIRPPAPAAGRSAGGDESWWEPVIGARARWRLNDEWSSVASLELGGFGAGGNDLQVNAVLGLDYKPWERTSIVFGYRYYSMDYSTTLPGGTFAYDTVQHGPYIGVKILLN